jgi:hypothetical protein
VGRVLWRLGSRHQVVRGGVAAAKTMGKATARASRVLWLEITGFFFAFFALTGIAAAWREWNRMHSGESLSPAHIGVALAFSAVFLYLSASSFWRARRTRSEGERSRG